VFRKHGDISEKLDVVIKTLTTRPERPDKAGRALPRNKVESVKEPSLRAFKAT